MPCKSSHLEPMPAVLMGYETLTNMGAEPVYFNVMDFPTNSTRSLQETSDNGSHHPNITTPMNSTQREVYQDAIEIPAVRYTVVTLHAVVVFLGILGNALVLLVIYRKRTLRKNSTIYYILNLALCDLFCCMVIQPLRLADIFLPFTDSKVHFAGTVYCQVAGYFVSLMSAVGFHTMVAISQERLLLICYPLKAKGLCSVGRTRKILVAIWILSTGCTIPIPVLYSFAQTVPLRNTNISLCVYMDEQFNSTSNVYYIFIFCFYFALPLLIITVSYTMIFYTLYRKNGCTENEDPNFKRTMKVRKSLAKMMLSVAIVFAVCWGPCFCFMLYVSVGGIIEYNGIFLVMIVEWFPTVSACINPFIYTLNSKTFRRGFIALLFGNNRTTRSYAANGSLLTYQPSLNNGTSKQTTLLTSFRTAHKEFQDPECDVMV